MSASFAAGFFRKYPLGGARPDWENYVHFRGQIQRHLPQKVRLPRVARQNTAEQGAMSRYLAEGVLAVCAGDVLAMGTVTLDGDRQIWATMSDDMGDPARVLVWQPGTGDLRVGADVPGVRRGMATLGLLDALYVAKDPDVTAAMRDWQALWNRVGPDAALTTHWTVLGVAADSLYGYLRYYGTRWYTPEARNAMACEVRRVPPVTTLAPVAGWDRDDCPVLRSDRRVTRWTPMAWYVPVPSVAHRTRDLNYALMDQAESLMGL